MPDLSYCNYCRTHRELKEDKLCPTCGRSLTALNTIDGLISL